MEYDFGGYATKCGLVCTDGRVIMPDAFKHNDGERVPIVWQHDYSSPENILGYGILENRKDGVYVYGSFNDSTKAKMAKNSVEHGDITSMSIKAIDVKQNGNDVIHGNIKEVSLVVGGANPGAKIDTIMTHDDSGESEVIITIGDEGLDIFEHDFDDSIYNDPDELDDDAEEDEDQDDETDDHDDESEEDDDETTAESEDDIEHSDEKKTVGQILDEFTDAEKNVMYFIIGKYMEQSGVKLEQSDESQNEKLDNTFSHADSDKTVGDILNGMSEKKRDVMYYMIGEVLADVGINIDEKEEVEHSMVKTRKRVFEDKNGELIHDSENGGILSGSDTFTLTHDDEVAIMNLAKKERVSSFQETAKNYLMSTYNLSEDSFAHGVFSDSDLEYLHPDYKLVKEGEPDTYMYSQAWVEAVINKVGKSPKSRLRVRIIDAKTKMLKAKGYMKGKAKTNIGNVKLLNRTVDPQTVYVKDDIHRDDVIDITDFDIAVYENKILQMILKQELALAMLVGDGRDDGDPDKIYEEHIKPIWTDNEIFTIHRDLDLEGMKAKLQGTETDKYFGEDFILIESFIETLRMARIDYNGSGDLDMFCTPTIVNKMMLARDRNGRRIYNTLDELKSALNVRNIYEVELLDGLVRTDDEMGKHNLHAIFVNFADYETGSNKGGQITSFEDFDIDFNQLKYLKETRLSGMLTRIKSAIVIEEKQG